MEPTRSDHLKLYSEPALSSSTLSGDNGGLTEIESLCQAFTDATGRRLRFVETADVNFDPNLEWSAPVNSGVGVSPGQLRMDRRCKAQGMSQEAVDLAAEDFLSRLADLLTAKHQATTALTHREAELATCIPVIPHHSEAEQLKERLTAVLQGGAESLDCQAAGVYLLDDATSQLKLRSSWGLPESRLHQPIRPLAGAIADLEALSGHAVVLENDLLFEPWQVPEPCGAAVCVPISTPTVILGTLWLFSDTARDFDAKETNLIEILAGRIATELERDMLLREEKQTRSAKHELVAAAEYVDDSLPNIPPLIEGWEVAAAASETGDGETPPAHFHDWLATDNDSLDLVVANVGTPGLRSAMKAVGFRAAWRAEVNHDNDPSGLLNRLRTSFDTDFTEEPLGSLAHVHIDAATPLVRLALGGEMGVLLRQAGEYSWLASTSTPLDVERPPIDCYHEVTLSADDMLILIGGVGHSARCDAILEGLDRLTNTGEASSAQAVADKLVLLLREVGMSSNLVEGGVLALRAR